VKSLSWYACLFAIIASFSAEIFLMGAFSESHSFEIIGRVSIVFLSCFVVFYFAGSILRFRQIERKDFITLSLIIFTSTILIQLAQIIAASVAAYLGEQDAMFKSAKEGLYLGIPFCFGAMLTQSILGSRVALLTAITLSLMVGVYFPASHLLVPYVLVTSLVSIISLQRSRTRSAFVKAGLHVALLSIPFALGSIVLGQDSSSSEILLRVLAGLLGGVVAAFLVSGVTPILESLGGYVTDMRLLEMATLDHPLLKDLSVQAPGTWNHSMVIGMMVESAADSIGANPVLARVGAYFHDIGKTKKPLYFVENQGSGENPHSKLSPSMSALIIKQHVKDGIELARKYRLPDSLVDMIPQHHGTGVIEYFYEKAVKEAEEGTEVDQGNYTYPGPKPQTREAGILMLADGIEAAARTLSDPTTDRLQGLVQKMINKTFSSGQLNECDLTLRDLHLIAKSFTRVLTAIYHHRIAYAEPAEKVEEENQEDLKRLGQEE